MNGIDECEFIELPQHGSRYTWNDRQGETRVDSKIDWAFVTRQWLDNMPAYIANFLPEGISDHSPIRISMVNANSCRKKAFKFCNTWAQHPEFLSRIDQIWSKPVEGYKMYQIVYKLKQLKKSLQELNRQHFRNILTEANEDRKALEKIQKELQLKPGEARLQAQEKENY